MADRSDQAKRASQTLFQSGSVAGVFRMVSLYRPDQLMHEQHGHLIQIGLPKAIDGPVAYPKQIRSLLWELRSAQFIDGESAVMWAMYDDEEYATYIGIGVFSKNDDFAQRALDSDLVVVEV